MKKRTLFMLICISIVMLLTLISCGKPKSAQELYEKVDKEMSKLNSYEMDMELEMTFYMDSYKISSEATGHGIEDGLVSGDYYFYQEMNTTVEAKGLSLNQTQKNVEAYDNGNYFILNESDGSSQKLYSPLTAQEALDYRADNDMDTLDIINDCTDKTFSQKEDGTWEMSCSGYTKSAIEDMEKGMGLDNDMLDAEIMDMKMSLTADKDFRATTITLELVFEKKNNAPTVSITINFSKYDAAERLTNQLNTADYTQVADIRLLTDVEDMLQERIESEQGSFAMDLTQTVRSSTGTQSSTYKENNKISYGEGDSGYFYDIDATISNQKYDISYQKGVQTVQSGTQKKTNAQTEQEARAYIESLINSGSYDPGIVSKIEKRGEGVYRFTCNPATAAYESYYANMGGKFTSANQTITVTIKEGRIIKIQNVILAQGSVVNYGSVSLTVNTTVTFD